MGGTAAQYRPLHFEQALIRSADLHQALPTVSQRERVDHGNPPGGRNYPTAGPEAMCARSNTVPGRLSR
ncbi:hypothetical protein GCM10011588_36160 [Nocardia jinanensis]|uniref:Uncharacterized protein n=1 Tax=Nocardia jinanensis TaxID=382504 RepID=A0A917RPW6_9NOCA|nr:hypothetical protein GCM10011588_36160 [Nocardia jinanensis]